MASFNDDEELVSVLETTDIALLTVVKSLLESAGIPFIVQGDNALGLLPVGREGTRTGWKGLAANVLVPRMYKEDAEALLEIDDEEL